MLLVIGFLYNYFTTLFVIVPSSYGDAYMNISSRLWPKRAGHKPSVLEWPRTLPTIS